MVAVCHSREELRLALPHDAERAVVMTMGALHVGHASLVEAARRDVGPDGHVTVTVFVNPLQFGPREDFARYPRTPQADIEIAAQYGADLVFLPSVADIYGSDAGADPDGITVSPGRLGAWYEGEQRPGHFAGVLTVVLTLLQLSAADRAYFGEKDYQQLTLIRSMARRFCLPVHIIGVPTVRDDDGLALSSRNVYLSAEQRQQALAIPRALAAARNAAEAGADADVLLQTASEVLAASGLTPDYLALTAPDLGAAPAVGEARLLVAARVGTTRLLDNICVHLRDVA